MNINYLKSLTLDTFALSYANNDTDFIFVLNVPEDSYNNIQNNNQMELIISINNEDKLQMFIEILNLKGDNKRYQVGFEIHSDYKEHNEVLKALHSLLTQESTYLYIYCDNNFTQIKLSLHNNLKSVILAWLENTNTETPSLQEVYHDVQENALIPYRNNTSFCFLCKVNEEILQLVRENTATLELNADYFEGDLVLYTNINKILITSLTLPDSVIDDDVRDDFKLLLSQEKVNIFFNTENPSEEKMINIFTDIHPNIKKRLKYYLSL